MSKFIVIGSGPGGTATALRLLESGHKVLMLERGNFLPKEDDNRDSKVVYGEKKYRTDERWADEKTGENFQPWMHYHVGGNAKIYGAAMYRFRPADFGEITYPDGLSPAWPIDYAEMETHYDAAEELYTVAGNRNEDPSEPTDLPFPLPGIEDENFVKELKEDLEIQTHTLALGISENKDSEWDLQLEKFDAYPDPSFSKSDPESRVLQKLKAFGDKFELRVGAKVTRLCREKNGNISSVELEDGEALQADCYVLAAGAINSARLLLESGFGEDNDLIGANYMAHLCTTGIAVFDKDLELSFAKTFGTNEWYKPGIGEPVVAGSIQTQGKWDADQYELEEWTLELGEPEFLAKRAMEFFYMTEDLPLRENRLIVDENGMSISRKLTNEGLHSSLVKNFTEALSKTPHFERLKSQVMPLAWCTHQCGTLVFGEDAGDSVLDVNCRLHSADNLYVTDASFFPSSTALNPTLTIIANALRVGEILGKA